MLRSTTSGQGEVLSIRLAEDDEAERRLLRQMLCWGYAYDPAPWLTLDQLGWYPPDTMVLVATNPTGRIELTFALEWVTERHQIWAGLGEPSMEALEGALTAQGHPGILTPATLAARVAVAPWVKGRGYYWAVREPMLLLSRALEATMILGGNQVGNGIPEKVAQLGGHIVPVECQKAPLLGDIVVNAMYESEFDGAIARLAESQPGWGFPDCTWALGSAEATIEAWRQGGRQAGFNREPDRV